MASIMASIMATDNNEAFCMSKVPQEVYDLIFHEFLSTIAYQDEKIIDLLLNLGPKFRGGLTRTIKEIHRVGTKATVTYLTQNEFGQKRLSEMLQIKKLNLVLPSGEPEVDDRYLNLAANKMKLINNLRVIEIDARLDLRSMEPLEFVTITLMNASRSQVQRIIIRTSAYGSKVDHTGTIVDTRGIMNVNRKLRTDGKLMRVVPLGVEEIWFWQRPVGQDWFI